MQEENTKMRIPLFKIYWDNKDLEAVRRVIERGRKWADGPEIRKFEEKLAKYSARRFAVVFNSGTSALHALMIAFGIGPGDEVIVPSFTFISTANTPLFVGAKPAFAEIEEETFGLDPKDVERKITKKTKAIIPIHYGGCPCKIEELKNVAKRHNVILIEDVAESLGAKIKDRKVGTFGDASVLSFCQNKIITTGEGGAIVTNSKDIYERLKLIRSHGRAETENYFFSPRYMDYLRLGYNFRMSDVTAALGISQLGKIGKIVKMRRKNANYFNQKLSPVKDIILPNSPKNYFHIYQMYTIRVKKGKRVRDELNNYLNRKQIGTKVYFDPVHLTSFYKKTFGYKKGDLPITEKISSQVLTLPMYPTLTQKEMDYIIKEIKVFFEKYERKRFLQK